MNTQNTTVNGQSTKSSVMSRMVGDIEFGKVDIADLIVVSGLTISLLGSIYLNMMELAINLASGLLGFVGGTTRSPSRAHPDLTNQLNAMSAKLDNLHSDVNANRKCD